MFVLYSWRKKNGSGNYRSDRSVIQEMYKLSQRLVLPELVRPLRLLDRTSIVLFKYINIYRDEQVIFLCIIYFWIIITNHSLFPYAVHLRSQLCINTAIVYMHRFYMYHSFQIFHRNGIAAASLFLSAKVSVAGIRHANAALENFIYVCCLFVTTGRGTAPQGRINYSDSVRIAKPTLPGSQFDCVPRAGPRSCVQREHSAADTRLWCGDRTSARAHCERVQSGQSLQGSGEHVVLPGLQ